MNHDIRLRAPSFLGGGTAPVVIRRTDQRFVQGILNDLKTAAGRDKLLEQVREQASEADSVLYLPTQRAFHVVIAEAYCDVPGEPRVAGHKITGAGVVLRRRLPLSKDPRTKGFSLLKKSKGPKKGNHAVYGPPQRWVAQADKVQGWQVLTHDEHDIDPDSKLRPVPLSGNALIDRRLHMQRLEGRTEDTSPYDEVVTTMFVAPPDVCEAAGATIMFGVVQPVEREVAEKVKKIAGDDDSKAGQLEYSDTEVRTLLPVWLRFRANGTPIGIPGDLRGRTFRVRDADNRADLFDLQIQRRAGNNWEKFDTPPLWKADPGASGVTVRNFMRFLWQVRVEFDAWGASNKSKALKDTLDSVTVRVDGTDRKLGDWLFEATEVFVMMEEGQRVTFPDTWPLIPQATHTAFVASAKGAMERRLLKLTKYETRYSREEARYQVRAFARVVHHDDCPPALVWTRHTKMYRVARWYEGGPEDAALPTIELPTISRGFLKQLQPNVVIKVPRSMFNFTNNLDMQKVFDGDQKNDTSGPDFAWICGFNISIIFMIAFMLLISFVFMLNIVFWWVIFFRICIPLPGVSSGGSE